VVGTLESNGEEEIQITSAVMRTRPMARAIPIHCFDFVPLIENTAKIFASLALPSNDGESAWYQYQPDHDWPQSAHSIGPALRMPRGVLASMSLDGASPGAGFLTPAFDVLLESLEVALHTSSNEPGGVADVFNEPLRLIF
jgi:hypothetical protein